MYNNDNTTEDLLIETCDECNKLININTLLKPCYCYKFLYVHKANNKTQIVPNIEINNCTNQKCIKICEHFSIYLFKVLANKKIIAHKICEEI